MAVEAVVAKTLWPTVSSLSKDPEPGDTHLKAKRDAALQNFEAFNTLHFHHSKEFLAVAIYGAML